LVGEGAEPDFDSYTARRLGVRQGHNVVLFNAPTDFREALEAVLPNRAGVVNVQELGENQRADVALIWPATVGLFEQSMRELHDKASPDVTVWVILDTEGLGLRERHVPREDVVARAIDLGYQDVGLKRFSGGQYALKLVVSRAPRS
jgi:hypothetical protein